MTEPVALAIAAGMAATVNPCGFALLPAYLAAFVGMDDPSGGASRAVARALAVSAVLTAGFVVVFGAFGVVVTPFALQIERHLPWVTILIGVGLVGLGAALLGGREIALRLPKLSKGGRDGTLPSMFLFGVSFAVASLSCTIGPFLAVTTTTFRAESWFSGMRVFVAYGLGMGVVITILTVSVALAREGVVRRVRGLLPRVNRIAGVLLVVAGAYVSYYGWYEIRVLGGTTGDPIVDRASAVQSWVQRMIVPSDPSSFLVAALVVIGGVGVVAAVGSRRRAAGVDDAPSQQGASVGPGS
jgi:cytochrome c-type biogenesis protein